MPPTTSMPTRRAGKSSGRDLAGRITDAADSLRRAARVRRQRASASQPTPLKPAGHEKLRHTFTSRGTKVSVEAGCVPSASPRLPLASPSKRSAHAHLPLPPQRRPMDLEVAIGRPPLALRGVQPVVNVGLPRKLIRPDWKDISRDCKMALHPGLADVPANYVREKLVSTGLSENMFKVIRSIKCDPVTSTTLPEDISVTIKDLSGDLPTHVFAVYASQNMDGRHRVTLHPLHNMVLSSHCANLPPLRNTPEAVDCEEYDFPKQHAILTVPVIPLVLPHPPTFPHIIQYLYTKKTEPLMVALLPAPPREDPSDDDEEEEEEEDINPRVKLAQRLARTYDPRRLFAHTMLINGLWRNAVALGVYDEKLWMTMDVAWDIMLTALRIASPSEAAAQALSAAQAQKPVEALIAWAPGQADAPSSDTISTPLAIGPPPPSNPTSPPEGPTS